MVCLHPLSTRQECVLTRLSSLAERPLEAPWHSCIDGGAAAAALDLQAQRTEADCHPCHAAAHPCPHARVWWRAGARHHPPGCLSQQTGHRTGGTAQHGMHCTRQDPVESLARSRASSH